MLVENCTLVIRTNRITCAYPKLAKVFSLLKLYSLGDEIMVAQKKRVYVCFDFDNDKVLKDFIIGQSKLPDSPFEVSDWSMKEAAPQKNWEDEAQSRIDRSDIVIVMVGPHTYSAPGVLKEINMAQQLRKSIWQIIGYRDSSPTPVPGAGRLILWNWDNLKKLFA